MIQRKVSRFLRVGAPVIVALSLCFLFVPAAWAAPGAQSSTSLIGPKARYLALGDSLAFGLQPNLDFTHGYTDYFYRDLRNHGVKYYANLSCSGESTITMIHGGCPAALLRKFPYAGPQLKAALAYLHWYAGEVSPVTLDIGANDYLLKLDINPVTCTVKSSFPSDLAKMDADLTGTILPALAGALKVHGVTTGDLILLNYYDPYQNVCPNVLSDAELINRHLAADASGFATLVDIFSAFGGATTPNPNICAYTWMCHDPYNLLNIHATDAGYQAMAGAIEQTVGY